MCTFLYFRFGKHACLEDWFFKHCTISLFLVLTLILKFLRWLNVDDSCWHSAINIKSMLVCANYVHACVFVSFFFVLLFSLSLVSFSPCTGTMVCIYVAPFIYSLILFHLHLLCSSLILFLVVVYWLQPQLDALMSRSPAGVWHYWKRDR